MSILVLNAASLRKVLSYEELLEAVEDAMLLYDSEDFIMPDRLHLDQGENTLLYMPSLSGEYSATKLVSVYPANPQKGLPAILGTVILSSAQTGEALAIMDASTLTALRTGAIAGVASRYTTPTDCAKLGVIGAGIQGIEGAISICTARPITEVYVYNRSAPPALRFKERLGSLFPHIGIHLLSSSKEILRQSSIIFTATNSSEPVLPDEASLLEGKHFIAIGSYKPTMREWPDSLFPLLKTVYIDVHHGMKESGDLKLPIDKGWITPDQIETLGKRISAQQVDLATTTGFKSVGMALFDLAVARKAYQKAKEENLGVALPFP
ncbi:MAG: ornithine cyclodeaminase family protein [Bacteroidota bacterium]